MYDESEVPLDVIIDLVQHVHAYEGEGAILIFLSGWEEISAVRLIPVRGSRILYKYVFSIQHVRSFFFLLVGSKREINAVRLMTYRGSLSGIQGHSRTIFLLVER